jgi:hypothetical protein
MKTKKKEGNSKVGFRKNLDKWMICEKLVTPSHLASPRDESAVGESERRQASQLERADGGGGSL